MSLDAKVRESLGKNSSKKIRAEKNIPASIFAKGEDTRPITISARDFDVVFKDAGMTSIIDVIVDGKKYPTIIKDVDRHPFKNQILHVNFQGIRMDETIKVEIPIEYLNKDSIRVQPSVFMQVMNTLNVECLPGDIPESISIDVQDMQYDDSFTIADLDITKDEKVTILHDLDETICILTHERMETEEPEEEEVAEAGEVPVVGEEETEETEE
ncbi:MAG: 50S ribosomal protein L25 [Tissierellia bacterium]|nr:50S ribosomal protein L25 [Tissierellia bacterium]